MKKVMTLLLIGVLFIGSTLNVQAGFTPRYDVELPKIPDIKVELSDEIKAAVDQAVKKQLEKMILDKPNISLAIYSNVGTKKGTYTSLSIAWNAVENATSYKVKVTKKDGTSKTYDTKYGVLNAYGSSDGFIVSGMSEAVVKVRAYGEDGTYSLWSDEKEISEQNYSATRGYQYW